MALELVKLDDQTLPAIANAIRAKTGDSGLLLPSQMAEAIAGIQTGVTLPALSDPAAVGHVLAGKEYIDGNGAKQTGTLVVCDTVQETEDSWGASGIGLFLELESSADGSLKRLTLPEENLTAENIKSGVRIFGVAGVAKTMRIETGTITPAEDVIDITIPVPFDGYCALLLIAEDRTALEEKGANSIYSVRVMSAMCDSVEYIGIVNRYNGSTYSAATKSPTAAENGNIYISGSTGRYYRAGIVYNYYVYYWEDAV